MRGIPSVKTWVVTALDGRKTLVLAPTRYLALLNYRFDGNWGPVKSIGLKRDTETVAN